MSKTDSNDKKTDDSTAPPSCGINGCERDSQFLLTCGDRCREHAMDAQPETVHFIETMSPNPEATA